LKSEIDFSWGLISHPEDGCELCEDIVDGREIVDGTNMDYRQS